MLEIRHFVFSFSIVSEKDSPNDDFHEMETDVAKYQLISHFVVHILLKTSLSLCLQVEKTAPAPPPPPLLGGKGVNRVEFLNKTYYILCL